MIEIKKYLEGKKIIKGNLMSRVFSVCKKATAMSCVIGLVMITNAPLVFAYEAHTVNVTARIVNDIPNINPPDEEFCSNGEFLVELSVSLASADICYTTNGRVDPVCGPDINSVCELGVKYNGTPFGLQNGSTLVKAVACHEELRNGYSIVLQSAIMEKEFNDLAPVVNVFINKHEGRDSRGFPEWYCGREYQVDWEVGNYRPGSVADIIYIVDKNDDGVIGAGDDIHLIAENLLTENIGNYLLKVDFDKGYCYIGLAWVKIIVTEPNGCGGLGISEIIYEPMPPVNNSCGVSAPDIISAVSESEPIIDDSDDSDDLFDNADSTSNDNLNDDNDLNFKNTDEDNISVEDVGEDDESENIKDEDSEEDVDVDDLNLLSEDENSNEEVESSNTDLNEDEDEDDSIDNKEEDSQENGIVIDREEDFDEEEDNNDEDEDEEDSNESEDDDDIVVNSNDSPIDESIDDGSDSDDSDDDDDDDDSPDDAPIEADDDSTKVGFSL